jgi:hypothetical protein
MILSYNWNQVIEDDLVLFLALVKIENLHRGAEFSAEKDNESDPLT